MSLGESERSDGLSSSDVPENGEAGQAGSASWSPGEDAVPLRAASRRAFEHDREERLRDVLEPSRRPGRGARLRLGLGLAGIGVAILAAFLFSGPGGDSHRSVASDSATAGKGAQGPDLPRLRRTRAAEAQRRAATQAMRKAARRRRASRRYPTPPGTEKRTSAVTGEASESSASAPIPAPASAPETTASPTSDSPSQAQSEFGFER